MDTESRIHSLAPVVVRLGMAFLFLWFGVSQLSAPAEWLSWLPAWTASLPIAPTSIVLLNGGFETVLGLFLAVGFLTRWAAALLAIHLFVIAYEIGYNDIGIRDFALAIATAAVGIFGKDAYSLDNSLYFDKVTSWIGKSRNTRI